MYIYCKDSEIVLRENNQIKILWKGRNYKLKMKFEGLHTKVTLYNLLVH